MLQTASTRLVGCSVPIQQAGMGGAATPEFATDPNVRVLRRDRLGGLIQEYAQVAYGHIAYGGKIRSCPLPKSDIARAGGAVTATFRPLTW